MPFRKLKYIFVLIACLFSSSKFYAQNEICDILIKESRAEINKQNFTKALGILSDAKLQAEKEKNYQGIYCALNTMAECYYYMLDYGEALNLALQAYDLAKEKLDVGIQSKILINIGALYLEDKNYVKGEEYLTKAYNVLKEQKKIPELGTAASNLGDAAILQGNYTKAMSRYNEALKFSEKNSGSALNSQLGIIECQLHFGKTDVARQKALAMYQADEKSHNDSKVNIRVLNIVAQSYLMEKKYDSAYETAFKILNGNPNADIKNKTFKLLVDISVKSGDYKKALKYKDSVLVSEQVLSDIKNGRLFETNRVKFEIANYKNEIALKDERINSQRKIFYSSAIVFIAIVTIIILILRQKKATAQLKLEKKENENLVLEKQMLQNEMDAQAEQEHLRSEIESRNRELSAKALYLSGRNKLIEELLATIGQSTKLSKDPDVTTHVSTLKSYLKYDKEWDSFISHFEEVNPGFLNRLKEKHPELSLNDVRFIIYLYMNLSIKEIASMFNITPESCRKRKERIAAKMNIPLKMNLYSYISTI